MVVVVTDLEGKEGEGDGITVACGELMLVGREAVVGLWGGLDEL